MSGRLHAAVWGVGAAQLYAWGVIYYPFSVTGKLIAADVGVSLEAAFFGFSLLLIMGALTAPLAGRLIDRIGGRPVMTLGCLFGAASLAYAATVSGPVAFFASYVALGLATSVTLYDASFASIVQVAGDQGRRAITYVTFLGGFASTVFWPITAWLCDEWGWRATYFVFAAGLVLFSAPIYAIVLRPAPTPQKTFAAETGGEAEPERPLEGRERRFAFTLLAVAVAAHQFVIAALLMHMIRAMQNAGLSQAQAIMVGMAFGPGQVLGRFGEMLWGARFPAVVTGRVAMAALPLALFFPISGSMSFPLAILFSAVCGMSNGMVTIARGTVSLALFGKVGYGAIVGDLALASLFARAGGPVALAYGLEHVGLRASAGIALVFALAAVGAMEILARLDTRRRQVKNALVG
ncbi:MAG: MFS transporter [Hyphomicrobiales bacterium]|nr:MFS transporter [Hyphomicrobiales bacterium]